VDAAAEADAIIEAEEAEAAPAKPKRKAPAKKKAADTE
jgi:trigger factor